MAGGPPTANVVVLYTMVPFRGAQIIGFRVLGFRV